MNRVESMVRPTQLGLAAKVVRLRQRLRDPEWRRYGYLLMGGKMLGVVTLLGIVALLMNVMGSPAHADDVVLKGNDIVNPINTVWTLVAAFLVFGMQPGFTMLEAGFSRSRETVNVLMECVVDMCLCGLLFYAWGFAFMFGSGTPFFGTEFFFLQNTPTTYGSSGVAFLAFWIFQYAFADTCSTITSGAMIGRTAFVGDLIYSVGVSGFIYPIFGHWLFASGQFGATGPMGADASAPLTGLFYGGGFTVLTAQAIGSAAICLSVFVTTMIMMYAIHAFGLLRVSTVGELEGLDLHEHGVPAYPEYALHGSASPQGAPAFTEAAFGAEARAAMVQAQKMAHT
jgi:ammonia channel protein AmtB